jgi:multiple sugar transport system substrate-binding protein
MKRLINITLVMVFVLSFLAGCAQPTAAPAATQPAADAPALKLSIWTRVANQVLLEALAKGYNATHKNQFEVTSIPNEQFVTKFGAAVSGGTPPDVISIDLIYVPAFAAAGQMSEITDLVNALPFKDKLSPAHMALATYNGKYFATPFTAEGSVLLYNKDLFKAAGLDPEKAPTTWDEIYQAAKKITALGKDTYGFYFAGACAGCNAFTYLPLIWASGGDVLSADYTKATLTNPAVKSALEFYKKMWDEKLIPEGAKVDAGENFFAAFATGKIGMVGSGAFSIASLKKDYPNINFGIAYLPGQNGGKSSFAGGDSIGVPKGSKYVKEAFDFIQWCLSDEVQLEYYAKTGGLPVRTDLAKNKYFDAEPRLTVNAQAMALGKTPYSVKYNDLFNDANGPWLAMIQTAIFEGKVDTAIAAAQDRFTQIMSQK